jgi:hypothetical protein
MIIMVHLKNDRTNRETKIEGARQEAGCCPLRSHAERGSHGEVRDSRHLGPKAPSMSSTLDKTRYSRTL